MHLDCKPFRPRIDTSIGGARGRTIVLAGVKTTLSPRLAVALGEAPMKNAFFLFVSLFAFYVVLSGQIQSGFLMLAGAVCCLLVTLLALRLGIVDDEGMPYHYWPRTALYLPWLMWQVVLANWDVLKRVWKPGALDISPHMIVVPHELRTPYGLATYMNSITLTPGTVTVDVGEGKLLVHALTKAAAEDLLSGEMHRRVKVVEGTSGDEQHRGDGRDSVQDSAQEGAPEQ
ncbi:Na+/H+ antiporter subunit E [Pseudenhygromyxa sp. WMMC2535]|uniref:Na+/H+ antiporter subunit E n=1 Tax=Pseudenhygromyxa sp. WMMC2535 TaxID=2712867 RepID=UPI00159625FF|nr:Na+/H+ antiporter subunit E [Pseudenhygromyxa sp. WMMC2535]NVB42409.1 Na+/H+ antiporter subunit E [Pseudenhygromyxa sp. WMMC2535]